MANRHSNKPILTARDGKLLPLYMEPPLEVGADLVTGGCAPVTVTLSGTTEFCYFPSAGDAVVDGDALIVVTAGGLLCVDYKVPPHGAVLGGEAQITVTLGGVTQYCYLPSGGVTLGGEAGAVEVLKVRGGKGTPYHARKRVEQATHHYYQAHAFFENTKQLGGEAEVSFRPAPYQFIKSLPKIAKPDPQRDSEFVDLFKKELAKPQTTTFYYSAEGGVTTQGEADEEYFDFGNFIITHDEDLILTDILASDGTPIITTVFDHQLQSRKRDEEELLELLDVL